LLSRQFTEFWAAVFVSLDSDGSRRNSAVMSSAHWAVRAVGRQDFRRRAGGHWPRLLDERTCPPVQAVALYINLTTRFAASCQRRGGVRIGRWWERTPANTAVSCWPPARLRRRSAVAEASPHPPLAARCRRTRTFWESLYLVEVRNLTSGLNVTGSCRRYTTFRTNWCRARLTLLMLLLLCQRRHWTVDCNQHSADFKLFVDRRCSQWSRLVSKYVCNIYRTFAQLNLSRGTSQKTRRALNRAHTPAEDQQFPLITTKQTTDNTYATLRSVTRPSPERNNPVGYLTWNVNRNPNPIH